ncbi:MAG: hypothetical protein P0119_06115 [Nitrospira sp.]|nr:hypothetical protein [Nitrospira sp.]
MELLIKQLIGDSALSDLPTPHRFANETYFNLLLLTHNLVNCSKRFCLPPDLQDVTRQTLRHKILSCLRSGRTPTIAPAWPCLQGVPEKRCGDKPRSRLRD